MNDYYSDFDSGDEWETKIVLPVSLVVADYESDGWWAVSVVTIDKNRKRGVTVIDRDKEIHTLVRRVVANTGMDGNNIYLSPAAEFVTTMVLTGEMTGMKV